MAPLWFYKWCHKGEVVILVIVEVGPLLRSGVTWVVGLEWGDNGYWKIRWSLWRVCNTWGFGNGGCPGGIGGLPGGPPGGPVGVPAGG